MAGLAGELAALGTALLFAGSSTFFALASRSVGSTNVNRARLLLAVTLAILLHWVSRGEALPLEAPASAWGWLALSGVVGLALGDALLFHAYVLIGPALSMLVFAVTPVLAALFGRVFLGEVLSGQEWGGIALTLFGIAWVVLERKRRWVTGGTGSYAGGVLLAVGGALGQALGLITAKLGLAHGIGAQSANLVRLLAAAAAVWIAAAFTRSALRTLAAFGGDRRVKLHMILGALAGPVGGVWLSLIAIERAPVGIASTLMSLTPIFLLPIGRIFFSEPITYRAVLGTLVAIAGGALLFR